MSDEDFEIVWATITFVGGIFIAIVICHHFPHLLMYIWKDELDKSKKRRIKDFYGKFYEECERMIDEDGWIRMYANTPKSLRDHFLENKNSYESRAEFHPEFYKTYIRPIQRIS